MGKTILQFAAKWLSRATAMLALIGAQALAQAPPVRVFLEGVNERVPAPAASQIATAYDQMWKLSAAENPRKCKPTAVTQSDLRPATADRLVFNAVMRFRADNGWTVRLTLAGCPADDGRFLLLQVPQEPLLMLPANVGETLATFSQKNDVLVPALLLARKITKIDEKTCPNSPAIRVEPRVTARGADLGPDVFGARYAGQWQESWTITLCGQRVDIPVSFKADGDGGVYHELSEAKAKLLPR